MLRIGLLPYSSVGKLLNHHLWSCRLVVYLLIVPIGHGFLLMMPYYVAFLSCLICVAYLLYRCYVACDTKEKSVFTCVVYTLNSSASSTIYDAVVLFAIYLRIIPDSSLSRSKNVTSFSTGFILPECPYCPANGELS